MLKIDKNCWIVYNQNNTLVTIEVANRDNYKSLSKIKGYNEKSILDNEYDNADYVLLWDIWDNKSNIINEEIKQNIDKKLSLKDYLTLKYKTSTFNRIADFYLTVGGQLMQHSYNKEVIDLVYNTVCSHFEKTARCWRYQFQSMGSTYCTRDQAKQVLNTFEQMEKAKSNNSDLLK